MAYLYQLDQFEIEPKAYSHLYYCYRKVFDTRAKHKLMLVENLHYQLIKTAWFYKDLEVAKPKLIWWYEEIQNTFKGNPRHPLTKLFNQSKFSSDEQTLVLKLCESALAWLMYDCDIDSEDTLIMTLKEYFLALEKLKISCLGNNNSTSALVDNLAKISSMAHYIYYLPELIKRDLLLPNSDYAKSLNINLSNLKSYANSPELTHWLNQLVNNVIDRANKDLANQLDSNQKKQYRSLLNNCAIWKKLAHKTQKNGFDLFNIRVELSPLQMLCSSIF